jgi:hypothetical protein
MTLLPRQAAEDQFPSVTNKLQTALRATCFHAGFSLSLFFDPEYGSDMFL